MADGEFRGDELEAWLKTQPREIALAIAARAAMRVFPLVADWVLEDLTTRQRTIILPLLRALAMPGVVGLRPTRAQELNVRTVSDNATRVSSAIDAVSDTAKAATALFAAKAASVSAAVAARAVSDTQSIARLATRAAGDARTALDLRDDLFSRHDFFATDDFFSQNLKAAYANALKEDRDLIAGGMNAAGLARTPLWHGTKVPKSIAKMWGTLSKALLDLDLDWSVWTDWYDDHLQGTPEIEDLEIARLELPEELWEEGPKAVNPAIRRLIDTFSHRRSSSNPAELVQCPAPNTFRERDGKLEAEAARERPMDLTFAEDLLEELREKAQRALKGLEGNYADPRVIETTQGFLDCIRPAPDVIREGRLLMRVRALEADVASFADAKAERERSIRSIMIDLANSAEDLLTLYPKLQDMEAERQALRFSSSEEHYRSFRSSVADITEQARESEVVGQSAVDALEEGTIEQEGLDILADTAPSAEARAEAIKKRSQIAGYQALDVRNFVTGCLKMAMSAAEEVVRDGYREAKKGFVKGIGKGAEGLGVTVMTSAPIVLVAAFLGPVSAIAIAIPSFASLLKNAKRVTGKTVPEEEGETEDSEEVVIVDT